MTTKRIAKPLQELLPQEFREAYYRAAAGTYQYIGDDVEALGSDGEGGKMSRAAWIEVVRDANYISSFAADHGADAKFVAWLKANEYNQKYDQDMNALVSKAIFGR